MLIQHKPLSFSDLPPSFLLNVGISLGTSTMKLDVQSGVKFVLSSTGLVVFCLCADRVVFSWEDKWKRLQHGVILRAIADNVVHGIVAGWCWTNVVLALGEQFSTLRILQIGTCIAMASAVDLDHFIEAQSLSVKDVLNLQKRPFAHNTSLVVMVTSVLYLLLYLFPALSNNSFIKDLPAMFLLSTLSHHLRDADRRGIWLGPFLSTPPIPHKLYTFIVVLLPTLVPLPRLLPIMFRALVEMPKAIYGNNQRTSVLDV